jgi:copper chaperone NosL
MNTFLYRRRPVIAVLIAAILLLAVSACTGATNNDPDPPVIHYGEDICEFCGMIISEKRYAAGYVTQQGEEYIFDDLGDMFQTHLQQQDEVGAFFVHDYEDTNWIRAETAHFVLSKKLPTPMLSGLVACSTSDRAKTLAAEVDGQVLTFDETLAHFQEQPPSTAGGHGMHNHQ